jgi:cytochrome c oxidase subunit III
VKREPVLDLSDLPTYGFGSRMPTWWGTLAFISLEATGFALAVGTYLLLFHLAPQWPLGAAPPDLLPGTLVTVVLLLSVVPNYFLTRWARAEDLAKVRIGLVVMTVLAIVPTAIRIFEFPALNVSWDTNAYGSTVWLILGLHTAHLVTDLGDTVILAALMFTRHAQNGRRFSDVEDNAFYWNFVVLAWLPIYFLIYWVSRL